MGSGFLIVCNDCTQFGDLVQQAQTTYIDRDTHTLTSAHKSLSESIIPILPRLIGSEYEIPPSLILECGSEIVDP